MSNVAIGTHYVTIASNPASVAAPMPDGGVTSFAADLVIDEVAGVNWEGGAASFVSGLQAGAVDLQVTLADGETPVPFAIKQFSQTVGARKLIIGMGLPALASDSPTQYQLWRGVPGGPYENRLGVAPQDQYVGYWPFESATGTSQVTPDWTGRYNARLVNGATVKTGGVVGNELNMDVTDNNYTVLQPYSAEAHAWIDGDFSISYWMECRILTGNGDSGGIISNYTIANRYRFVSTGCTGRVNNPPTHIECRMRYQGHDSVTAAVTTPIAATRFHGTMVCHRSAGKLYNYINGVLARSNTGLPQTGTAVTGDAFEIFHHLGGRFARGFVDEVQVHNRPRSADWIATYYAMTHSNNTFWTVGPERVPVDFVPRQIVWARFGPKLLPYTGVMI